MSALCRGSVAYESRVVDGYDIARLACCLRQRGLWVEPDEIVGVGADGARVDLRDEHSIWVLPRWIEGARDA